VSSGASEGDVRIGSGGAYIFPFFQYTSKAADAITGFTLVRDAGCPAGFDKTNIDLNKGAGGSYNYLCFTRRSGDPVTDITFLKFDGAYGGLHYDYWHVHPQKLLDSGSFKHVYVGYKLAKGDDLETLLFNKIAAADYAGKQLGEDPGVKEFLQTVQPYLGLIGPADFIVNLLVTWLSEEDDESAERAHIMEAVSHLVDDRFVIQKENDLKNIIEDIQGHIEDTKANPDEWLTIHSSFKDFMNDFYGGGSSSCWSELSDKCIEWRNNGKALVLVVEFTELLLMVSTEVHDYILDNETTDENKRLAIPELAKLVADLKEGTKLLSVHFDHFQKRRKNFDSPDHGLLARVDKCDWDGCELTGPYDQMLATRICTDSVNARMLKEMFNACEYVGCENGCDFLKGDGCTKVGSKSWHCPSKDQNFFTRNFSPPSCYEKGLDDCIHEYKKVVDRDLKTLNDRVNAISGASAKVVKDAEVRSAVA